MTPRTQSQQITVQKVNISVQVVLQIVVTHKTKVTNKSRHLFCVYIVYGHYEMPIFGRHTKTCSCEYHECIGSPLGPDTQEISHIFCIQTEKPETQTELG